MKPPIFVRPLTDTEREAVEAGLRSSDAFVLRRCQILLASARGERAVQIARQLGCDDQTVRNGIQAFHTRGLACLAPGSRRAHTIRVGVPPEQTEPLRALLHQSPRAFGKPTSVWTLPLVAEVSFAEGITPTRVTGETIRATLARLGIGWRRAKRWITSPDPEYLRKKSQRDRLIRLAATHSDWALGFEDEVWWSRLAQPALHSWTEVDQPLRLVEQSVAHDDPDPKALACYGLLLRGQADQLDQVWLRFVQGRPISALTTQFLDWCCTRLADAGKTALLLVWDNASWHRSKGVQAWVHAHNRQVKTEGAGVRLVVCPLPIKSPWLNPIEPRWVHGKRTVMEPDRLLAAHELADRVCAYFGCPHEAYLTLSEDAA